MPFVDLTRSPQTDPLEVYRYRDGLYAGDLVTAALTELDFFTWLTAHPSDLPTICRELKIVDRPADVMLTLFVANGWVQRSAEGRYETTLTAQEHLVGTSPWYLGPYYGSLKERPVVKDFVAILRSGKPAHWGSYKHEKEWSQAMLTEAFATQFTAAMDCRGMYLGLALAKKIECHGLTRLLDIAGGSGIYACVLTANHPALTATVFERAPVDRIARTMIEKRGYSEKVNVTAGDMFVDPLPLGHDLHLYSNVIHDWDFDKVRFLLAASFKAMTPGGMLMIHDAHLNREKTGPLPVAEYSAVLMSVTEGKCYSISELEPLLRKAGFHDFQFSETAADRSVLTARKPTNG